MKPSDFFLGVIDFFSVLVPGAIATYLLFVRGFSDLLPLWPRFAFGSPAGWTLFLVSAFVLGHFISAIGSFLLDPSYDRLYALWRRTSFEYLRTKLGFGASWPYMISERLRHVSDGSAPDDPLLRTARVLKNDQLQVVAQAARIKPDRIGNMYDWAGTVARLRTLEGASEIEKVAAQSKFFRSLAIAVPFVAYIATSKAVAPASIVAIIVICEVAEVLSLWRFFTLRWDATKRTYEYFIATSVAGGSSTANASGAAEQ